MPNLERTYAGLLESAFLHGEAKIKLTEEAISFSLEQLSIPYASIRSFALQDYCVTLQTDLGYISISGLGTNCSPFYQALFDAYNQKVLEALFVEEPLLLQARGDYRFQESEGILEGQAIFQLYKSCVCILPPNENARKIPFCFITGLTKGLSQFSLTLDTGEVYDFMQLGPDSELFEQGINEQLQALRANALQAIREFDSSLTPLQAAAVAKLLPRGTLRPLGLLAEISPSFVSMVEAGISQSDTREIYLTLRELCTPADICVGMKSLAAVESQQSTLWFAAPLLRDGLGIAAVESALSSQTSSTLLYRFSCSWEHFYRQLNHAMDAVDFHREAIFLTETDLRKPQNIRYSMAIKRSRPLQFLRSCFSSQVFHTSLEKWKDELLTKIKGTPNS